MWWIFIIAIWIVLGLAACKLAAIDWDLSFGNGVEWEHLWWVFIICMILPFVSPIMFITEPHHKEIYKIFFGEIGDWFKDHVDWKW